MSKRKSNKPTVGQKIWFCIYRADQYDKEVAKVVVPANASRSDPQRATRAWLEGMSRNLKDKFPAAFARVERSCVLRSNKSQRSQNLRQMQ